MKESELLGERSKGTGHVSIARVKDDWYIACASKELRRAPKAFALFGTPLVLFRDADGNPGALLDRCAHRNAPLSLGAVKGDHIQCRYHGWRYDRSGTCREVPGLGKSPERKAREIPSFACREQDDFLWVYATAGARPCRPPFRFPHLGEQGYSTVRQSFEMKGTIHAVAENALDALGPHILRLLRDAEAGKRGEDGEPSTRTFRIRI